ncbi:hypothetical protein [Tumidithrix helvetica]|uniref:hypothetical protein n=1 Tax=Tumidithrix helvetica TaxID=3457545 RepID=UPI003CC6488A
MQCRSRLSITYLHIAFKAIALKIANRCLSISTGALDSDRIYTSFKLRAIASRNRRLFHFKGKMLLLQTRLHYATLYQPPLQI